MGTIHQDRDAAIAGELGKRVPLVPVTIDVIRAGKPVQSYQVQMVNDPLLSPLLLQMAVFSTIGAGDSIRGFTRAAAFFSSTFAASTRAFLASTPTATSRATLRRALLGIPSVTARKVGARPTGSTTTSSVSSAETM